MFISNPSKVYNLIGSNGSRPSALCCSSKAADFILHNNSGEFSEETAPDLKNTEIESL